MNFTACVPSTHSSKRGDPSRGESREIQGDRNHVRVSTSSTRADENETYRADRLRHLRHAHHDREPAAAEGRDGELVLNVARLRGGVEHAHVVELREQLGLHACAEGVRGRE